MTEEEFRELIRRIVEMYQISAETASELLRKILTVLSEERQGTAEKERDFRAENNGGMDPACPAGG